MKKLLNILRITVLVLIGLILFIIILPFIIVSLPFTFYSNWKREKALKNYIHELGDKNFFCYNNRKDCQEFIENKIIPMLNNKIELIYLDGKTPDSEYKTEHLSLVLYKLQNYTKYPHLIKFRNDQMIDKSINNELFNSMNQDKPIDELLNKINEFFEIV